MAEKENIEHVERYYTSFIRIEFPKLSESDAKLEKKKTQMEKARRDAEIDIDTMDTKHILGVVGVNGSL